MPEKTVWQPWNSTGASSYQIAEDAEFHPLNDAVAAMATLHRAR